MPFRLALSIALRHLRARRRQSLLAMLGIVVGGAIFALMVAVTQGQRELLREKLIEVSPHITLKPERLNPVVPRNLVDGKSGLVELTRNTPPRERKEVKPFSEMMEKIAASSPLVAAVAPHVLIEGVFRNGSRYQTVTARGVDPGLEAGVGRLKEQMQWGKLDDLARNADGVVIGRGLSKKLSATLGDDINFITPSGAIRRLRIVGVFESGVASFDDKLGYINLVLAQTLRTMPRNSVTGMSIQVRDLERVAEAKEAIEAATGYRAETWEEINGGVLDFQGQQGSISRLLVIFVFITAAFGIANTLVAIVLQKKIDIAVMKSFGVSRGGVVKIFLLEGAILGVVGGALAAIIGYGLAELFGSLNLLPRGSERSVVRFDRFPVSLDIAIYLGTFFLSLLMSLVASALPARRAAKLIPVVAIREG